MQKVSYHTSSGLEKLREELHELKTKERRRIAQQLAEARAYGDLSENAEYDAAKHAQGMLEMRIAQLEHEIASARIIDQSKLDSSRVAILNKVTVRNQKQDTTLIYQLVPEKETNLKLGKISISSPIGKGLVGKKVGDVVTITIPAGELCLEILSITHE